MRRCELCKAKARMYCASDRASLCWDCDAAVHSANFLVARHSRNLLCDVCQSPTPWATSGGKLGPTVSLCVQCAGQEQCDDSGAEESEEEEMEVEVEAEEEESQVVPWSPPPAESSSSDDEPVVSRKRLRIEADRSYPPHSAANAFTRSRTASVQRVEKRESSGAKNVNGSGFLDSLRRFHREEMGPGQQMIEFCDSFLGPSI